MLDKRQMKAIELLLEGHKVKEVAAVVGVLPMTLYHWIYGDPHTGKSCPEFSETYKKLKKSQSDETNENFSQIRLRLSKRVKEWVDKLKAPLGKDALEYSVDIIKALKEPPQRIDITQIYNMQFQTPEDIVHEFKRLNALAGDGTFAPSGRAVQGSRGVGSTKIPLPPEGRGKSKKKDQSDSVLPESETGSVSQEPSED